MFNDRCARNRALASTNCMALLMAATPVIAQTTEPKVAAEQLETIVVTAQKRSERLQDVPIQVDVLTAENIAAKQIKMGADIVRATPSLTVEKTDTYTNSVIVLRGISQASNADTPVAVIVDGVPQDDPKQFNMHLFDVEQIEVLKGPQGSLYGRKAEAGAIIITTAAPTNELRGFGNVSFSRGETLDTSAGISGPVVEDKVLFRLAGNYFRSDGYLPNSFRGVNSDRVAHDWSVRGTLLFNMTDRASLSLIGQHQDFDAGHVYFAPVFSGDANDFQSPRSNFPNRGDGTTTNFTAKFSYDFDFATLTSISGYTRLAQVQITDLDLTNSVEQAQQPLAFPFQFADNQPFRNKIFSQEFRLTSRSDQRLRWLVSADYLRAKQFINTHLFLDQGDPVNDPFDPALTITENPANYPRTDFGVSAQVDYDVLEKLTLTLGGRYDSDRRKQENLLNGEVRKAKFTAFQPKVSVAYKLDSSKLFYATYAQGFRSGGFNPPSYRVPIYGDERLSNYEIGFKSEFFNRALTLNGAVFHSIVEDMQDSFIDLSTGSRVISNIDRVRIDGLELEARLVPAAGLTLYTSLGLTDPDIRKYSLQPSFEGNVVSRGYKLSVSGGFDYSMPIGASTSLFLRADAQHYGRKYWYIDNLDVQKAKTYVNGSLGAEWGDFTLTFWGKNILDERAYETYFPSQATGFRFDIGFPNRGASYGVELSTRF